MSNREHAEAFLSSFGGRSGCTDVNDLEDEFRIEIVSELIVVLDMAEDRAIEKAAKICDHDMITTQQLYDDVSNIIGRNKMTDLIDKYSKEKETLSAKIRKLQRSN